MLGIRKDLIVQETMSEGTGTAAGALAYCKEFAQASLLVDLATEYPQGLCISVLAAE